MILGIDASNIKGGGGVTHLKELLENASPAKYGFTKVILWSVKKTLSQIEDRPWLTKIHCAELSGNRILRWYWQRFKLSELAREEKCDLLFVPGGSFSGNFRPFVTMSQNLLPFEWGELRRYGFSIFTLRLILLYFFQGATFRKAQGIIFLTKYAEKSILSKLNISNKNVVIIPHGISKKFFHEPKIQSEFIDKDNNDPIELLYVSFIGAYKHQWNVVEAVAKLNMQGIPIHLSLVGALTEKSSARKLRLKMDEFKSLAGTVSLYTDVSYEKISQFYKNADLFLFASTCENLPNILIEAMASGLPIVSSNFGPMPEVLEDAGLYINPLSVEDITNQLKALISSKSLRTELAAKAFEKAKFYSWVTNAEATFSFFQKVVISFNKN